MARPKIAVFLDPRTLIVGATLLLSALLGTVYMMMPLPLDRSDGGFLLCRKFLYVTSNMGVSIIMGVPNSGWLISWKTPLKWMTGAGPMT